MRDLDDIPQDFGHWFAGFVDGEGCFQIMQPGDRGFWQMRFEIGLRIDDLPILEEVKETLDIGKIGFRQPRTKDGRNSAKAAHWLVCRKDECAWLADFFERFPLRAKKARDFEVWARAARLFAATHRGGDYSQLASLQTELREGRKLVAA